MTSRWGEMIWRSFWTSAFTFNTSASTSLDWADNTFSYAGDGTSAHYPEEDVTVLVYDQELDDVLPATVLQGPLVTIWRDQTTDQPLPDPTWWAYLPRPDEDVVDEII
jgi:hypothetical protein